MKRRDVLRVLAGGAAMTGASLVWPRRLAAAPFGEVPDAQAGVMLPAEKRVDRVLECFLYGGLTTSESFYCVPEFGEATNTWAYAHYDQMVDAAVRCGFDSGELFTPFADDSEGRTIYLGPILAPLLARPDVLDRMRIVVNRHLLEPHEAAIPLTISGKSLGSPSLAALGTHVARYFVDRDDGTHAAPFAYGFATAGGFIPNDNIRSLVAPGLHPGAARPLLIKVDNVSRLDSLLSRTSVGTLDERARFDALIGLYYERYNRRLRFADQAEVVRALRFQELTQAARSVESAAAISSVLDASLFERVPGAACGEENEINVPAMSLRLATHLLTHPLAQARHCCVVDTGLTEADGGGGYDTHEEAPHTQARNFNNFVSSLLPRINLPGEGDPAKLDLDRTLIILNMEFGRAPSAQNDGQGRNHWPYGYVQVYFGGPVQKGVYGAIAEDGHASVFTTPSENRIAALLALGIWPFDALSFNVSDVTNAGDESSAALSVTRRVLGVEL
jgi:hypothetical protein